MTTKPRSHISVASIALFLGGLLWIAAFWFPVFKTAEREIAGYWVFVSGWMGFVVFQFAWYANLFLLIAVILMYTAPVRATIFAAVGLLVATQAFWFDVLPETTEGVVITAKGLGFWFWYAGIFLMSVGVFFCLDSDEVTDVIEMPEVEDEMADVAGAPEADLNMLPSQGVVETARPPELPAIAQKEVMSPPDENPFGLVEVEAVKRPVNKEVPAPLSKASNPFHFDSWASGKKVSSIDAESEDTGSEPEVLSEIESRLLMSEGVLPETKLPDDAIVSMVQTILHKTDEEVEVTVPAVTSILQDAVFPEIKKPKQ